MTWLLKMDDSMESHDYCLRYIRGVLSIFHAGRYLGRAENTTQAKQICHTHYWRKP